LALIVLCAFFVIRRQNPPDAQPISAPVTEFASGRAAGRLKVIAREPHPVGPAERSEVRDYILKKLTGLGLSLRVSKMEIKAA
jgi:hypothetical protein